MTTAQKRTIQRKRERKQREEDRLEQQRPYAFTERAQEQAPVAAPAPVRKKSFLPSANSAQQLLSGDPMGLLTVSRDIIVRAGLIGLGLYIAGDEQELVKKSLIASVMIEGVVLFLAAIHKD